MRIRVLTIAAFAATTALAGAQAPATPVAFTVAGSAQGFSGDGRSASRARLNSPAGVAVGLGSIFVSDTINQRIRAIDGGQVIRTIAGNGRNGYSGDGGPAPSATLQDPTAIEVTDRGIVFADSANDRVRVVQPDGTIATLAGTGEQGFEGDGGTASRAELNGPSGVEAVGGTILVADGGNNRIRAIGPDGRIVTVAGTGARGFAGDGGPATAAQLNRPAGLAIAPDGSLLVADSGNQRIRRIGQDGRITTVAGNGVSSSSGDGGPAVAAALNDPVDVAASAAGEVFIAEAGGNRVRRVARDGTISRFAGAGGPRYRGDGGPATRALLNSPRAVEIGAAGDDLLIADSDNNRIRYVTVPTDGQPIETAPHLLAIAPLSASRTAPLRKRVVAPIRIRYTVMQARRVTVAVNRKGGRFITLFRVPAAAGTHSFVLAKRLRRGRRRLVKGFYTLTFTATGGSRRVTKSMELIVR